MESVLVCIFPTTRAHRVSFKSIKRHVLDELKADLALAVTIDENYDYENRFWQHAKYRWTAPNFDRDLGEAYDFAQSWACQQNNVPAPDWRLMLQIEGVWQGGIRCQSPQPSHSAIFPFGRWLLLRGLQQDGVLDRYDRFVLTRSEFVWLCPHPPLSILDREAIWVPDGACTTGWPDYGGLNDRHLVVSRADVVNCLNVIEDILLHPAELYEELKRKEDLNNEQILAHHLDRKGLLHKVKRFPNVGYLAREVSDDQRSWSWGDYEPAVGHYVKYVDEYRASSGYATLIRSRADWEKGAWRQFDYSVVANLAPRSSFSRRVWHSWKAPYYRVLSALRRPGRLRRLMSFSRTMFKRASAF
jgi:hypothetical protein